MSAGASLARVGLVVLLWCGASALAGPVQAQTTDTDGDGLPDAWEVQFGLDPASAAGPNGASGDPDGDFLTNAQELAAGTHPRGVSTRYLAEGATGGFFDTTIAIANADPSATARVLLRFLTGTGAVVSRMETIGPHSRRTVIPEALPGLEAAEFSTVIESDVPVVVDRTMRWDAGGYGSHAETAIVSPGTTWYLAEGATHSNFDLFYLLQNPSTQAAAVTVTYLRPSPLPAVTRQYTVAPLSRFNIWVDQEGPELSSTDVSAIIQVTNGVSIIVERAMYLNAGGRVFGAGHESAGVRSPSATWFLAEGATGPYFDLFVLIANPYDVAADIEARYLLPSGTVLTKRYRVEPKSRFNIWVDLEDAQLADTAVSTTLTSLNGVGVIAERAMWWPGPTSATWAEAHNAAGASAAGARWVLAEGEVGGAASIETYILIANTSSRSGDVLVRVLFEDGATAERTYTLAASSRFNVPVGLDFPEAVGKRFSAVVESLGTPPLDLVVERAVYDSPGGERWTAGSDALGALTQSTTDSDGDGVTDVAEAVAGSNPQSPDSDGDGVSDGEEVARRTSPTSKEIAVVVLDPVNGERNVAVSREVIARFSQPLAAGAVLDASRFYATFAGQTLPARIDVSSDRRKATLFFADPLPSASRIRVVLDGNGLATVGGPAVDADGDGDPGGVAVADIETTSLARIDGTDVWGYVYDAYTLQPNGGNRPIVGATIRIDGFPQANAVTDANGYFILRDMPAPEFFVHIDGTTATNAPAGFMYPSVGKPFHSVAGQSTQLTMDGTPFHVYLPPMAMGDVTTLSATTPTRVGFGPAGRAALADLFPTIDPSLWLQVSATVAPNGAETDAGTPVTQSVIIPVPPQRLPAPLPPGARPQLVISVQALGATNFDTPAPVCFPNLPDAVTGQLAGPGTLQELMSFNHDAGRWDPVGPMRVNTEGRLVCTEPGVGVLAPGWHYPAPPPAGPCEAGPSEACPSEPPPLEPESCPVSSPLLSLTAGGPVFAAQNASCPKKPREWWDLLGMAQDAVNQWLQDNVFTPFEQAMHQYNQQYSPTTSSSQLAGSVPGDPPVAAPLVTAPALTFLDNCLSRGAFDGAIYRANGARAVFMALGASRSPSTIADVVTASAFASRTADDVEYIQALQCRDGASSGGTVTRPDEDPTAAQIIQAGEQVASLLYPLAVGRSLAMTPDVSAQVDGLLAQAAALAGGDPIQWLRSYIVGLERQQAIFERAVGEAPGYDTLEPLPYAAHILTTTGLVVDRGMTRAESNYALLVPPDQTVIQNTFYLSSWKLFAVAYPRLAPTGRTVFPRFHLANATASDLDGDGLPDVGESVYGTSTNDADSDDDGVKDGAEVAQGTDPLDTRPARTGVIRSIDTPGTAVDVCALGDSGLVADRLAGVTVLGIDPGGIPTVTGRVDTPGDALAVACAGVTAVVADGPAGVAILDVRVPAEAYIRDQVAVGGAAQAVAADQGVAYVGTTTGQLVSIDLSTGAVLDVATLPTAVQDVSIAGDVLYAMTDGAVHTFPLGPSLALANSVASPRPIAPGLARLRLFAGTDTLYATHSKGFNVFDLTNPLLPGLVVAGTNPEFGWRQLVPNGSGLGLAAVDGNQALDGPQDTALYGLANRNVTTNRLLTMPTPGQAFAVTIANGYGLVADGSAGLQVVNYIAADTGTTPPTLSVTTNQPPGTAEEGRLFRVTAHVTDDVQVRAVEFWIDGALALTDTAYPFEFRRTTPLRSEQTSFTLLVRALDTGGNVAETAVTTVQITGDLTPPVVTGRTPRDGAQVEFGVAAVSVSFDEPIRPSSITTGNFRLLAAGPDGLAGTGDDVPVATTSVELSSFDRVALLATGSALGPGLYRAVVGPGVSDVVGNVASGTSAWTFNVALGNLAAGEDFTITGNISSPGAEQNWLFVGNAGQEVFFDGQNACGGFQDLRFTVTTPAGATLLDSKQLSGCVLDVGSVTLPASGTYRVQVFGLSGAVGAYTLKLWNVPTPVAVPLTLNQTIGNGPPTTGAGVIARPGERDVFALTLTAGQRIYADGANPCGSGFQDLRWRLTRNSDQAVIFPFTPSPNTAGLLTGCSQDVGPVTIPTTGAYTLTVYGFDDDTGAYTATLWDATPPAPATLTLNQTISNGVPAAGFGNLEWPGQTDVYTLTLSAGQRIYADGANPCGFGFQDLRWRLTRDSDQAVIFPFTPSPNTAGQLTGCSQDVGPVTIPSTGTYTLTVYGFDGAVGTYTATLWDATPPAPATLALNQTISNGVPAAGFGNIEWPGQTDVYTLTLSAGQRIYADGANPCGFGFQDLRWRLTRDSDQAVIFPFTPSPNTAGQLTGCTNDVGPVTIPTTGTYTLTVYGFDSAVGTYTATIWDATPPAPVAIAIGDTVSNGVPVAGAGNLETPGASDIYTFSGTANQVVNFDGLNPCGFGFPDLRWTVRGPGNEVVFENLGLSGCQVDPGNRTLPVTGTYTITVTGENGAFAPYSFRIQ